MCRMWRVLALLSMYLGLVNSWDIAVSVADELIFYTNKTITATIRFESQNLTALAYDEVHNSIVYVDQQSNGDAICSYSLSSLEHKCLTERNGRNIHGIAYDPVTNKVFFTDTNERTVNWISVKPGSENNTKINLLIKMDEGIPRDIAVDSCKGYVYWLNTDMTNPTIERARFSGAEREVFENATSVPFNATHKLEPYSLVIDQQTQALHWFEPLSTTRYEMGHSNLTKRHKTLDVGYDLKDFPKFTHPSNKITVLNELLMFIVDVRPYRNIILIIPKNLNFDEPDYIIFPNNVNGIVANYRIADQIQGRHDCEGLRHKVKIAAENYPTICVHGVQVGGEFVCECVAGFTGESCEISVCNNYCIQGNCSVNDKGFPECSCDSGYSGVRCEINPCQEYCLNGGDCLLNDEEDPVCQCVHKFEGTRCETDKSNSLTNTLLNMTLGDLLSKTQHPSSKIVITVDLI